MPAAVGWSSMQIELHQLELRYDGLRAHDAARASRMRSSLATDGQQSPVLMLVSAHGFVLVDGYLRVAALKSIGRDLVDGCVIALGESDALIHGHRLDEVGRRSALEEGWLLDELVQHHGLRQVDLARRLGRSRSWVNRRIGLVAILPAVAQRAVREGSIAPQAAMKFLVPLSRDNSAACERIVTNLDRTTLSVRETGHLARGWRAASAEVRSRIEANPRLFLRATEPAAATRSPTDLVVRELSVVSGACARANRTLASTDVDGSRSALRLAFREASRVFSTLTERMTGCIDAGPEYADRDPSALPRRSRCAHDREDVEPVSELRS